MSEIILDVDNWAGTVETFRRDKMTGKIEVKKIQDVDPIFSANKDEMNAIGNNTWKGDMHKVASIPWVIAEAWQNELKAMGAPHTSPFHGSNRPFLIAKLNDYNYSKLRTKSGRV